MDEKLECTRCKNDDGKFCVTIVLDHVDALNGQLCTQCLRDLTDFLRNKR